jgi:pimeloyl-ACP methyl ester carboxylesterase
MRARDEVLHSNEERIEANGIELVYDTFGHPTDLPILLIMGLGAQMIAWHDDFCSRLAGRGTYVIRYDNRDVGLSTKMSGMPNVLAMVQAWLGGELPEAQDLPYTIAEMAGDAAGLLDALSISSAHVAGISMGGMIAQHLALNHPQRVRSLTLISTTSGNLGLPRPDMAALGALMAPPAPNREERIAQGVETNRLLSGDLPFDADEAWEEAARAHDRSFYPEGTVRQMAAILAVPWYDKLPEVAMPTLVIHGEKDPLFPLAHGEDLAATIPDAWLHVVEGGGHNFPRPAWPELIAAITQHVKAVERGEG